MAAVLKKSGVIYGDDVRQLFLYAQQKGFAIPAINVTSSSTVVAALEAARDNKAPIILKPPKVVLLTLLVRVLLTRTKKLLLLVLLLPLITSDPLPQLTESQSFYTLITVLRNYYHGSMVC